ncbi:MAG TPA: ABC transporter permease, partial [Bacillota bacterium]|nr:ABC transporter permease [Bacillota bacterium]
MSIRSLWQRGTVKREIDEELRFHLERRTAENIAAGMAPEEAAREARKRFGNLQGIREECRAVRSASFGEATAQDVRFGLRMLARHPGFAAITVLTLALGVAGNIVIFSVYNAFYLRPFPFAESSRLVDLDETAPRWNLQYTGLAYPDFCSWREQNRSFEGMAAWSHTAGNMSFEGSLERVRGARVTHDLATVLRIQPILGRHFSPDEDRPGGAKVVLLGNGFWKRQFGARADVLGKSLKLDHEPFTIIGVLPPDEGVLVEADFWVPLAMDANNRGQGWFLKGVGRLKNGIGLEQAQEDLRRVHLGLVEDRQAEGSTSPRLTRLSDRFFGTSRPLVQVMLGAVGVVLLIACGNVAALMLARGLARSRELALRQSLGATPWRLAKLIGTESLLLAGMGGLAGMLLGKYGLHLLLDSITERPPCWMVINTDWRVWLFAGAMVLVSALLGALPVLRSAWRLDLRDSLQSSAQQSTTAGGGRQSLQLLVVAEVALTFVMMIQAGLLVQTSRALQRVDPGFRADHVLAYQIALPSAKYASKEARTTFFQEHLERVRHLPGVESTSAANMTPLNGHSGTFYMIENAPPKRPDEPQPVVLQRAVCPGYFETLGVTLLSGRTFTEQD